LGAVGNLLFVEGLLDRFAHRGINGLAGWRCAGRERLCAGWDLLRRGKSLVRRDEGALGWRCAGRGTARRGRRAAGLVWRRRRGRDRGARRHLLDRGPLVGWDDDALGWRCSRRCTAWRGRRHHGFGRWSRGRTLPFPGWWPFLLLLVLALVLLVGLGLSEHACAEALDRLGLRKAAGAGRKGEDTKESCQGGARHCWSRTSWRWWREPGASPGGARP